MIPTILLILPITALLMVIISALVPVSVFWAAIDFLIKLRIKVKTSAENIPENDFPDSEIPEEDATENVGD